MIQGGNPVQKTNARIKESLRKYISMDAEMDKFGPVNIMHDWLKGFILLQGQIEGLTHERY